LYSELEAIAHIALKRTNIYPDFSISKICATISSIVSSVLLNVIPNKPFALAFEMVNAPLGDELVPGFPIGVLLYSSGNFARRMSAIFWQDAAPAVIMKR